MPISRNSVALLPRTKRFTAVTPTLQAWLDWYVAQGGVREGRARKSQFGSAASCRLPLDIDLVHPDHGPKCDQLYITV